MLQGLSLSRNDGCGARKLGAMRGLYELLMLSVCAFSSTGCRSDMHYCIARFSCFRHACKTQQCRGYSGIPKSLPVSHFPSSPGQLVPFFFF